MVAPNSDGSRKFRPILTSYTMGCLTYRIFEYYMTLKMIALFNKPSMIEAGNLDSDETELFSNSLSLLALNGWCETALQLMITPLLSKYAWAGSSGSSRMSSKFQTF
jgi:hypothetical protein